MPCSGSPRTSPAAGSSHARSTRRPSPATCPSRTCPTSTCSCGRSGEQRTSNFLLWQSAYAEMVFQDRLWPDYDRRDLWAADPVLRRPRTPLRRGRRRPHRREAPLTGAALASTPWPIASSSCSPRWRGVAADLIRHPGSRGAGARRAPAPGCRSAGSPTTSPARRANVVRLLSAPPHDAAPIPVLEHYRRAAWVHTGLDDEANVDVRTSADAYAASGPADLDERVRSDLAALPAALAPLLDGSRRPDSVLIPWQGWSLSAADFVLTRTMEALVHSDDLAASIGVDDPALPRRGGGCRARPARVGRRRAARPGRGAPRAQPPAAVDRPGVGLLSRLSRDRDRPSSPRTGRPSRRCAAPG